MAELPVQFNKLGYAYQAGQWIFRDYTAAVRRGSIFAVLGPNGSGKTTLLKLLLGTLQPSEGSVHAQGRIGFVPQLFSVSFDYTVLDMVLMGRASHISLFSQPSRKDVQLARETLDRFGITDLAERPFHQISGGQRQLAIFARALVSEADILVLDEPTSALDLKNQAIILEWIKRLSHKDGLTIVLTTHHPHHALAIADDVLLMLGETNYLHGNTQTVLTEENLRALYGTNIKRVSFVYGGISYESIVPIYTGDGQLNSSVRRDVSTP